MESVNYYSLEEQDTFRTIFEVDIINFLFGSLAENLVKKLNGILS